MAIAVGKSAPPEKSAVAVPPTPKVVSKAPVGRYADTLKSKVGW
jgi:hypothetical protein